MVAVRIVDHSGKTVTSAVPAIPSIEPTLCSIAHLKTLSIAQLSLEAYLTLTELSTETTISPIPPTCCHGTNCIALPIPQHCRVTPLSYAGSVAVTSSLFSGLLVIFAR